METIALASIPAFIMVIGAYSLKDMILISGFLGMRPLPLSVYLHFSGFS